MSVVKKMNSSKTRSCFVRVCLGLLLSAKGCLLAHAQATDTSTLMTAIQANTVLNKKPPGFAASKDEEFAYWTERLAAAMVMLDGEFATEALQKLAVRENDPERRAKMYEDTANVFRQKNKMNEALRIGDAAMSDERLAPGRRALLAIDLARAWTLSNDYIRAERYQYVARRLVPSITNEEAKTLAKSIPLEIAANDLVILTRRGNVKQASFQADVVDAIYWKLYLEARDPEAKTQALGNWAKQGWDYSRYLIFANRAPQALAHMRQVIQRIENEPINPIDKAMATAGLALSLAANRLYLPALSTAEDALHYCEQAQASITSNNCALVRQLKIQMRWALNRNAEIPIDVAYLLDARTQSQVIAGNFSERELQMLGAAGRADWASARALGKQSLEQSIRYFGTEHAFAKQSASELALVNLRDPGYAFSKAEAERFLSSYLSTDTSFGDSSQRGIEFDMLVIEEILQRIIEGNGKLGAEDASELAFAIAEYLRNGVSQSALYDGAIKMAATTPELRILVDKEQALRAAQSERRNTLASALMQAEISAKDKPDEVTVKRQQEAIGAAQRLLSEENSRLKAVRSEIASRFPVYQELSNPRIPSVKELAAQLRPDEAYVSMYSGPRVGAVFVVTSDSRFAMHRVAQSGEATLAMVKAIRAPFDATQVPTSVGKWAGFNVDAAVWLYKSWVGVASTSLAQVQMVHLAPSGALASVPWSATLVQKPVSVESAHWFVQDKALAITPGASSVVLSRTLKTQKASQPFMAFAAPQFSATVASAATIAMPTRNLWVSKAEPSFDYSQVPALPDTLDEARATATALGADPVKDVVSGATATRSRVLAEKLDDKRMVEFATHGLLPWAVPRLNKPALAMAYEGRGLEDSLLTTDDIIGLKLRADWILLSACNTGLVESGAGDTISGMSRAFFAAGGKSVLATQWAVESESAMKLVVNTMQVYGADGLAGKAQSLATAQRHMASGKSGDLYRHPYFWAPYFVMGEP